MADRLYTASLSQNQDRAGYSIIFRHPVRVDGATGKPGLRVRRGLGTRDLVEAELLKAQLNEILAESRFHVPGARAEAERRFDERVVEIFYYKMTPEEQDAPAIREAVIRLPNTDDDYRRVLLLGTTGAGKTTLLRQLIGTDPDTERFPSTSTAKTTIHDTEIVLDDGPWRAIVTFTPEDEVREYLGECISAAVLAASKGMEDSAVLGRMLDHVNQRFRFSYVLGRGVAAKDNAFGFEEEDEDAEGEGEDGSSAATFDLTPTNSLLKEAVNRVRSLAARLGKNLRDELAAMDSKDERVLDELFEEELDNLLRDEEEFHAIADALMAEIERRFELVPPGRVSRTKQGWPQSWEGEWEQPARREFLRAISTFSSNHASRFGRLLTPLVNGVRVAGAFKPQWVEGAAPRLVLLDGEGLGHVPRSSSSVATSVSRRIEIADAVLLVDNAAQPMQAAPVAVMREIVSTGNVRKLILAFTHFDEVRGDNLPTESAKARHVLASAENVLAAFGEELGPFAERALRARIESARFFLARIDERVSPESKVGRDTLRQLRGLLDAIENVIERPEVGDGTPIYDRLNLVLAIRGAAESYLDNWLPRLGLRSHPGVAKEHWTRVRALSRRLATGWADEYDSLRPVADLRKELVESMYRFFQSPIAWDGAALNDDQKQEAYDTLADIAAKRLLDLATRRVWHARMTQWQSAYSEAGTGSSFRRARIIGEQIVESAAPVPDSTPSPDRNQFLHDVVKEVEAATEEAGARLR